MLNSVFKKLNQFDKEHTIHIFIPYKIIIPVVLILMALTGKVGSIISMFILVFLIFIFLIPDDV
ncbi:MAG: hypothetical protein ABIC96_02020 [Patescibacteria group bacterium]